MSESINYLGLARHGWTILMKHFFLLSVRYLSRRIIFISLEHLVEWIYISLGGGKEKRKRRRHDTDQKSQEATEILSVHTLIIREEREREGFIYRNEKIFNITRRTSFFTFSDSSVLDAVATLPIDRRDSLVDSRILRSRVGLKFQMIFSHCCLRRCCCCVSSPHIYTDRLFFLEMFMYTSFFNSLIHLSTSRTTIICFKWNEYKKKAVDTISKFLAFMLAHCDSLCLILPRDFRVSLHISPTRCIPSLTHSWSTLEDIYTNCMVIRHREVSFLVRMKKQRETLKTIIINYCLIQDVFFYVVVVGCLWWFR